MPCPLCDAIASVRRSQHPWIVADLSHTAVLLAEHQGCPGWCVAVLKDHAEHLAELPIGRQSEVFTEVARAAAAIRTVFGPLRINYECLGNQVAHVHWHIIPRHRDDPDPKNPVWGWTVQRLHGSLGDQQKRELAARLAAAF